MTTSAMDLTFTVHELRTALLDPEFWEGDHRHWGALIRRLQYDIAGLTETAPQDAVLLQHLLDSIALEYFCRSLGAPPTVFKC
jgi:hypothetical protein